MHDLVAHTLSIIIVQADGGRYAGTSNPGVAVTTMHTIRDEAHHALTSMNGLLGTLGEDEALKRQKQRTLTTEYSSIDALIHQAQAASGTSVVIERSLHGTPPARLPEELSEALFHTVQEALSNVRKYAGTKVHVDIVEWWAPDSVRLSITDDGQGARAAQDGHRPGYGLIGMKERVTALGGTLQAASLGGNDESTAAADHGFAVTAVIPLASTDSQAQETASSKWSRKSSRKRQSNANLIERISTWTQSHFAEVDLIVAFLLAVFLSLNTWYSAGQEGTGPSVVFQIIFDIAFCLPLALRRTRPQLSAAAIAGIFIISLLVGASLPFSATDDTTVIPLDGALFALVALYSVVVYGPLTARRWVYPTALCIIAIAVTNIWRYTEDQHSKMHYTSSQIVAITISMAVVITALVLGVVFFGLWKRARGSDIVLLRSREEALIHQRDRQAALAANLERARISEQIQQEVTQTLGSVLTSAQTWIGTLEDIHRRNPQAPEVSPSASDSHTIIEAFSSIAATGRQALAQMRELLGILRQNETPADASRPQLSPIMAPADRSPSIQGSSTNRS
jgi:signal transduction histidine kinase